MFDKDQQVTSVWLKRFTFLTAAATFVLIWIGGLVTSHNAGLAVPDWPTSYGYNMFFFPVSRWVGNILFEHVHRLAASTVGLLTTILAVWLYVARAPKWLRALGVVAFFGVVLQGALGGLRVIELAQWIGIFHAAIAQLFFLLVAAMALFQTDFWRRLTQRVETDQHGTRALFVVTTCLVLGQLMLGATMRHQHAGLSIPDFPTAYGKLWPDTDPASIARYNQNRNDITAENPITAAQVVLQMVHRMVACVILGMVATCLAHAWRRFGARHPLTRASTIWMGLVLAQAFLGAATIWTGKSADIATAHVACGALCLLTGGLTSLVAFRILAAPVMEDAAAKTILTPSSVPR